MASIEKVLDLDKPFVIVDWEAHKNRCDYRFKMENKTYCGTFGREEKKECKPDICPYVYMIVEDVKEISKNPCYVS